MKKLAILFALIILALAPVGKSAPDNDKKTSPQTEDVTACVGAPTEKETDRGTDSDETSAPETSVPETNEPETSAPETTAPETSAPETTAPETSAPETNAPETTAPETSAPETSAPETNAPETSAPETNVPTRSDFEREVARLVNEIRRENGLSELVFDEELSRIARLKSQDMHDLGYFDHNSPTYGSPFDMMKSFGVTYRTAGENIAYGYRTPEAVVDGWMNSPGHRANILGEKYKRIGIGYVAEGNYWTQMFVG